MSSIPQITKKIEHFTLDDLQRRTRRTITSTSPPASSGNPSVTSPGTTVPNPTPRPAAVQSPPKLPATPPAQAFKAAAKIERFTDVDRHILMGRRRERELDAATGISKRIKHTPSPPATEAAPEPKTVGVYDPSLPRPNPYAQLEGQENKPEVSKTEQFTMEHYLAATRARREASSASASPAPSTISESSGSEEVVVPNEVDETALNVDRDVIMEDSQEAENTIEEKKDGNDDVDGEGEIKMKVRAYQQEMLEESIKRNIIVCQGTGSGKTFVYSLYPSQYVDVIPAYG